MKTINYYITVMVLFLIMGCSKNDEDVEIFSTVESFEPTSIEFVHEDGTSISDNECITPQKSYAIQIKAVKKNNGNTKVSKVEYTINGVLHSMSFSEAGTKRTPIILVNGENIAELSATTLSDKVKFVEQDDFQLVL